jgi:hypothetical protein
MVTNLFLGILFLGVTALIVGGNKVLFFSSMLLFLVIAVSIFINGGTFGERCYKAGHVEEKAYNECLLRLRYGGQP